MSYYNIKSRRSPSLKLSLESANPHPFDVVGSFGGVTVNRYNVELAANVISDAVARLRQHDAFLKEVLIAAHDIAFGTKTAVGETPASREGLEGTPYEITLEVPVTTLDLAEALSEGGDVHRRFLDLVLACQGLCSFGPEVLADPNLVRLFTLRTAFGHAFVTALVSWQVERGQWVVV
jgi:hypothetical protein